MHSDSQTHWNNHGTADLVLWNGKIATMSSSSQVVEAVAVQDDRITAMGHCSDIKPLIGKKTRVIHLQGKLATPGLMDAHGHLLGLGRFMESLDLTGTRGFDDVVEMAADRSTTLPPGEWILGRGWNENKWRDNRRPSHEPLSRAVPHHPVWLRRIDGHIGIANRKAMEYAEITPETQDPAGGTILHDEKGIPTGMFLNNAIYLVMSRIPDLSSEQKQGLLTTAAEHCLSLGLTCVHDAGVSPSLIKDFKHLADRDELGIRVVAMLRDLEFNIHLDDQLKKYRFVDDVGHVFTIRSIKLFMDGALGSRGAALLEPYSDDDGNIGVITSEF